MNAQRSRYRFPILVASLLVVAGLVVLPFLGEPGFADPKTAGPVGLWVQFLGTLHPLFLHLPIGAFLLVLVLETIALVTRGRYAAATLVPLGFTLASGILALVFGYCLYLTGSYSGELVEQHKTGAFVFCGLVLVCLLLKLAQRQVPGRFSAVHLGYLASLVVCAGVMTVAGHFGGEITHGDPLEKLPARILAERRAAAEALLADPVIYQHVIQPILKERCIYCHGADKQEGDYRMDSYAALLTAGKSATGLVPGSLEESAIVSRLHLPSQDKHHMPPADKPQPTPEEIALIEWWIDQGAPEHKQRSELIVTAEAETALASLVSPAERKAREEEQKRREEEARRQLVADRQDIRPAWRAFEEAYPGALTFVSATTMEMRFNGISYLEAAGGDALDLLAPFADHLVEANFTLANLADDAAARLARFTSLRRLNLSQTAVTDAFLENLAGLANLESLNLYGTQVTPAVVASLQQLPVLNTLYIGETAIDAAQTVTVRDQLAADRTVPVTVIGADQKPDLALLSDDGVFRHKLGADQARYGMGIGSRADLTLSSADPKHHPRGRLPQFIADEPSELDFAFHTRHEPLPWVQLGFDEPQRVTAFLLKNRAAIPHRAEGLELQRLLADGDWETIWKADTAAVTWRVDLTDLAADKREADAFRFIINQNGPATLHLAHLSFHGQSVEPAPPLPAEAGASLDTAGQGDYTYVVAPGWGSVPGQDHIGPTNGGVAVDRAGRVYVSTDGPNGILVYRRDGTYLTSLAKGQGRYHGVTIHNEEGEEFLYAAGYTQVTKYRLNGEIVMRLEGAKQPEGSSWKKATAVVVAPDGSLLIADGYGSCVIHKYDRAGQLLKSFGARGVQDGQFRISHGLAIDNRQPDQPRLIVCDRENGRLQLFDLEGNFIKVAATDLRQPCAVSLWNDLLLVAELGGRAVLLDQDYQVVSVLGDNPNEEQRAKFQVHPHDWQEGVFTAPHGCSFDHQGNIYIQDWNKWGRVTKLLRRDRLTAADIAGLEEARALTTLLTGRGEEPGWLPSELGGLGLWLDADDLTTLTATAGRVSQWDDKSPNKFHAYALATAEHPQIGTLRVNGRHVLEFQQSRLVSKTPETGNWQDLYIVADWNGGAKFDNYNGLFTGFEGGIGVIGSSRGDGTDLWTHDKWWSALYLNGTPHNGANVMEVLARPFLVSCSADEAIDITGFAVGNDRAFVGAPNRWRDWEGAVCEVVAFQRKLANAERQLMEGYLAHKWGLVAMLPADHPYKTAPPTTP